MCIREIYQVHQYHLHSIGLTEILPERRPNGPQHSASSTRTSTRLDSIELPTTPTATFRKLFCEERVRQNQSSNLQNQARSLPSNPSEPYGIRGLVNHNFEPPCQDSEFPTIEVLSHTGQELEVLSYLDRLEEINKTDDDSPSTSHNDKKRPLVLNLENLHDISSELSSQGQILSQVVRDIQLNHKVEDPDNHRLEIALSEIRSLREEFREHKYELNLIMDELKKLLQKNSFSEMNHS